MAVYAMRDQSLDVDDESPNYHAKSELLDGDFMKVGPAGFDFSEKPNAVRIDDAPMVRFNEVNTGLRTDTAYLPTRIQWGGSKRELGDVLYTRNCFIVSQRFRDVVESLEPEKHQFEPLQVLWADGSLAGNYFWFFALQRLDSMDREHTTHKFQTVEWMKKWRPINGGKWVANLDQVGRYCIWIDPHTRVGWPWVSGSFKQAMVKAGITGLRFDETETV